MYIKTPATNDWGRHEYQGGRHTRLYFTDKIYKDVTSMMYKVGIYIVLVVHVMYWLYAVKITVLQILYRMRAGGR